MNMATGFDRRHPRGVILIRVLVTAWLLALTGILLAYGYWGWALLTLAGAVATQVCGPIASTGRQCARPRCGRLWTGRLLLRIKSPALRPHRRKAHKRRPGSVSGSWPLNCDVLPLNIKGASRSPPEMAVGHP